MSTDPPKPPFGQMPSTSSSPFSSFFGQPQTSQNTVSSGASTGQSAGSNLLGSQDANKRNGIWGGFPSLPVSSGGGNNASVGATAENKTSSALFGNTASAPNFGALGASQTPSKPVFGGAAGQPSFAGISATPSSTSAPTGSTTPAPSGFFNKPSTTPAGPPPVNPFGGSAAGSNLFGSKDKDQEKQRGKDQDTSTVNLFQQPTTSGAFVSSISSAGGSSLFAGNQQNKAPSLPTWGTKPAEPPQTNSSAAGSGTEAPKSSFGGLGHATSNPPSSALATMESQKSLVGGLGTTSADTPSSTAPSTSALNLSSFFVPTTSSGHSDGSRLTQAPFNAPTTTQTSTSGGSVSQAPTTSVPSNSLFTNPATTSAAEPAAKFSTLGAPEPSTSASQTATSSTAQTSTTSAPFEGLFKVPGKPASTAPTTSSTAAPTMSVAAATGGAPTATAGGATGGPGASISNTSTSGPPPPAQSRLRNKTMDEILTRWASDLTKYTKEFQTHAETVAHWDQLLVENMSKISKLYVSAVTSEKQTASVEMQLSAVENQQNELDSWLTKYEGEVDEMLAKDEAAGQGSMQLGGPDQERERTYKLAERLGERLQDMNKDLATMIDEINTANAGLSRPANADEPISQIVRILNSHLGQLQAIDQGTTVLQAKINAAHQSGRALGTGLSGTPYTGLEHGSAAGTGRGGGGGNSSGSGNTAVDDFYRSYMGRR